MSDIEWEQLAPSNDRFAASHGSIVGWLTLALLWIGAAYFLVRMPERQPWIRFITTESKRTRRFSVLSVSLW